jgi:hypothetical protein
MLDEIDPRTLDVSEDLRFETTNGRVLGPYEVSYDVRHGYEAAPRGRSHRRRPGAPSAPTQAHGERR